MAKPSIEQAKLTTTVKAKQLKKRNAIEKNLKTSTRDLVCPENLDKTAKAEWARIIELDNSRETPIIYDSDVSMLRTMCIMWSAYIECETAYLQNSKMMITVPNKLDKNNKVIGDEYKLIINPAYAEMRKLAKDMKPLYTAFAMTPQGRAMLSIEQTKTNKKISQESDDSIEKWYL